LADTDIQIRKRPDIRNFPTICQPYLSLASGQFQTEPKISLPFWFFGSGFG